MKAKLFLFIAAFSFVLISACTPNNPEGAYKQCSGKIIGTFGCHDAETGSVFYKGYFIETTEKEVFLSFNLDVKDSIYVPYGTYALPARTENDIPAVIPIPYSFYVRILKPDDPEYVHYAIPVEDTMHPPITVPSNTKIEQVIVTPINEL